MTNWTARLAVISGGLSEESSTHRLAQLLSDAVVESAREQGGEVVVERIDLRALAHDITTASLTGFAPPALADAYEVLGAADAMIAVTPTYKASFTGLFKSFWDATAGGVLSGVPVIVGATGGSARHSLVTDTALRPLFAYMKALVMPTAVYAAPDDWAGGSLAARSAAAAAELVDQLRRQGVASEAGDTPEGGVARVDGVTSVNRAAGMDVARGADDVVCGADVPRAGGGWSTERTEREDADSTAQLPGASSSSSVTAATAPSRQAVPTLAATRARARDPFVGVPTMEQMLNG